MSEQEYRLVADRASMADESWIAEGDRVTYGSVNSTGELVIVRIERPVLTTDGPTLTERLAELRQPVNGHRPYCLSNQPGDGPCNCDLGSPHPPTREQIAEAETRVRDWLAAHDSLDTDTERERPIVVTNGVRLNASDILALIQNGADR